MSPRDETPRRGRSQPSARPTRPARPTDRPAAGRRDEPARPAARSASRPPARPAGAPPARRDQEERGPRARGAGPRSAPRAFERDEAPRPRGFVREDAPVDRPRRGPSDRPFERPSARPSERPPRRDDDAPRPRRGFGGEGEARREAPRREGPRSIGRPGRGGSFGAADRERAPGRPRRDERSLERGEPRPPRSQTERGRSGGEGAAERAPRPRAGFGTVPRREAPARPPREGMREPVRESARGDSERPRPATRRPSEGRPERAPRAAARPDASAAPTAPRRSTGAPRPLSESKAARRKTAERRAGTPATPDVPVKPRGPAPIPEKKRAAKGEAAAGPMRLQRVLARAGVASRRSAESLITAGRVLVNGKPATLGQSVDPRRDAVTLDGAPVQGPAAAQWFVLHKPAGVLTTRKDPGGRRTVFDLVPKVAGLTYVGRLDYMTEGVLLLTTDGDAAHALTHPSREVERTYVAIVRGPAAQAVREARSGVELEDGMVKPVAVEARPLGNRRWEFEITIAEGRTREVRRLCEALALEVERLTRVQFGPVKLGGLAPGASRPLSTTEARMIEGLKRMTPRARPVTDDYDDEFDE